MNRRTMLGSGLLWLLLVRAPLAVAQESGSSAERKISLRECVEEALRENLSVALSREGLRLSNQDVWGAKGPFDPVFYGNSLYRAADQQQSSTLGGADVLETRTVDSSVGLRQMFSTGTSYDLSARANRSGTNSLFSILDPTWQTDLGVTLRQPLLRNAGEDFQASTLYLARGERRISRHELALDVTTLVVDVHQSYWNLVYGRRQRAVKEKSLRLAEKLLQVATVKVEAGEWAPLERLRAEASLAAQQEGILIAQAAVENAEDALRRLISAQPAGSAAWDLRLVPSDEPASQEISVDLERSFQRALSGRPELLIAGERLRNQDILVQRNQIGRLPLLDLATSYRLNGIEQNVGNSLDRLNTYDFHTWDVGFSLEWPLGNRAADAELAKARIEKRKLLWELRDLEQKIILEVRTASREVRTTTQRIEATRKARELAQKQLDAEELRYELGDSTTHQVMDFQEDLAEAESNEAKALIDHKVAILKLEKSSGTLLEAERIALE